MNSCKFTILIITLSITNKLNYSSKYNKNYINIHINNNKYYLKVLDTIIFVFILEYTYNYMSTYKYFNIRI